MALGDDLTKIHPDRMAMIPKCLPPFDVAARPLDLFAHVPSQIWDLHVKRADDDYHAVALFNWDDKEREIAIPLDRLGLAGDCQGWEFWTEKLLRPSAGAVRVPVPACDSRVVAIRRTSPHPQVLGTDMHLTMGAVDLSNIRWDATTGTLSGRAHRIPGAKGRVFVRVPAPWRVVGGATMGDNGVAAVEIAFPQKDADWCVHFARNA